MAPHTLARTWTQEELRDLRVLNAIEPTGDDRLDLLFALLCQTVANHSMGRKSPARLDEFLLSKLLDRSERGEEDTLRAFREQMGGWAESHNVKRGAQAPPPRG